MMSSTNRRCNITMVIRALTFVFFYTALLGVECTSVKEFNFNLNAQIQILSHVNVSFNIGPEHFSLNIIAR